MSKMQDLIKDAYKLSKAGNLIGICHMTMSAVGFKDIPEDKIDEFVENKVEMLYLKSTLTNTEIQIYENELKDYKIKNSEEDLYVLTTSGETRLMY